MTTPLAVGDLAPDFTLADQHGAAVTLSAVSADHNVALVFYPFAYSGICTGELREIRDGLEHFQHDGIQVLAISCDTTYSLRAWADQEGYFFPLLSDFWPHGKVATDYGVFLSGKGVATRGTFLLDRERRVRWCEVTDPGRARDFRAYRQALADLR
jgi:peroxiredoxin (alkyl hydroperoxide reductase subunit C)